MLVSARLPRYLCPVCCLSALLLGEKRLSSTLSHSRRQRKLKEFMLAIRHCYVVAYAAALCSRRELRVHAAPASIAGIPTCRSLLAESTLDSLPKVLLSVKLDLHFNQAGSSCKLRTRIPKSSF